MKKIISLVLAITMLAVLMNGTLAATSPDGYDENGVKLIQLEPTNTPHPTPSPTPTLAPSPTPTPWWTPTPAPITNYDKQLATRKDKFNKISSNSIEENLKKFTDVKNHWAKLSMIKLSLLGSINSYGNGLKPDSTMKVDEFIVLVMKTLGYQTGESDSKKIGNSYSSYIDLALKEKLISPKDFTKYNAVITKEQASKIVVKAILLTSGATGSDPRAYNLMRTKIKDYAKIGESYKQSIIDGFWYGALLFDKNMNFNPKSSLKRGEASAMVVRIIDDKARTPWYPKDSEVLVLRTTKDGLERAVVSGSINKTNAKDSEIKDYPPFAKLAGYKPNGGNAAWSVGAEFKELPIYSDGDPELMRVMKFLYNNKKLSKNKVHIGYGFGMEYLDTFLDYTEANFGIYVGKDATSTPDDMTAPLSFKIYNRTNKDGKNYYLPYLIQMRSPNTGGGAFDEINKNCKAYFEGAIHQIFTIKSEYEQFMKYLKNSTPEPKIYSIGNRYVSIHGGGNNYIRIGLKNQKGVDGDNQYSELKASYKKMGYDFKNDTLTIGDFIKLPWYPTIYKR